MAKRELGETTSKSEKKISVGSDSQFSPFNFFNKKPKKESDHKVASAEKLLGIWRHAVLAQNPDKEIITLLTQGYELNFALAAAIHKQFAILSPEHEQMIIARLLAHAGVDNLAAAAAACKLRLVKLIAAHLLKIGELDKPITIGKFKGATVLAMAAELGRLNIMRALIHSGANVKTISAIRNQTYAPFQLVVEHGYWEIANDLFIAGVDPNSHWHGVSAIYAAAQAGYLGLVKVLIRAGANAVAPLGLAAGVEAGNTPLLIAAVNGHARVVNFLAQKKDAGGAEAPCHLPMMSGIYKYKTPLELAASSGHSNVVRVLLRLKVPNDNQHFQAALHEAKQQSHSVIYKALSNLDNADYILKEALENDLIAAISTDADKQFNENKASVGYTKYILKNFKSDKLGNAKKYIPENFFGFKDLPELSLNSVKKLHEILEDLDIKPKDYSLARIINYISKAKVFHYLCTQGWDVHQHNQFDRDSAIICATEIYMPSRGDLYNPTSESFPPRITPKIVELLLQRGANPEDHNPFPNNGLYNYTYANPLHMVLRSEEKCAELIPLLIDAGADCNSSGYWPGPTNLDYLRSGYTPLHIAAKLRRESAVKILIEYDVNIYVKNSNAHRPIQVLKKSFYSSDEKRNSNIKNFLTTRAQDHWRHIALIADKIYAAAAIQYLISLGANYKIEMQETEEMQTEIPRQTALYWLVTHHPAGFAVLPADLPDKCWQNLLYQLAVQGDGLRLPKLLSLRCGKISNIQLMKPLCAATYCGHITVVEQLLAAGAIYDQAITTQKTTRTPLCAAAFFGHIEIVELLLATAKKSGKLSKLVNTLEPPLSLSIHPLAAAAEGGRWPIVNLLVTTTPVNIEAKVGELGMTALAYAVKRAIQYPSLDSLKIIKLLLAKGADPYCVCCVLFGKLQSKEESDSDNSSDDSYSADEKSQITEKKMRIIDMPKHVKLINDSALAKPGWMNSEASVAYFYGELTAALRRPIENFLNQLMGDLIIYDLMIQLLSGKIDFPSSYHFYPPQGDQLELKLTPAGCMRELLGLLGSHYKIGQDSPFGEQYHQELEKLQKIIPVHESKSTPILEPLEIKKLEQVMKDLYQHHLQILSPVAQKFQQTAKSGQTFLPPPRSFPTASADPASTQTIAPIIPDP